MIRDEFNKQNNKKVSARELEKIRVLGERGFYSSKVMELTGTIKVSDFSSWFVLITSVIATLMMVTSYAMGTISTKNMIIFIFVIALLFIWVAVWFIFIRRALKKKIERYKGIIKDLNEAVAKKNEIMYNHLANKR